LKSVSSILKASSAALTKEIEDIIDNIKKQSKLIQEAIKSTMEVFKRNKGLVENVSDVAEVSDRIEEVSANSEEVLITMD
jgi:methyl-accepting chemotaxis protein